MADSAAHTTVSSRHIEKSMANIYNIKIDGALILHCSVLQTILAAQPHILNYTIAHSILNICYVVRFPRANDFQKRDIKY